MFQAEDSLMEMRVDVSYEFARMVSVSAEELEIGQNTRVSKSFTCKPMATLQNSGITKFRR